MNQWVLGLAAAWDDLQPEDAPWRDYIANAGISELKALADPEKAETKQQREALRRVRLVLDALALRN